MEKSEKTKKRADNGHKKKPNWPNKRSIYGKTKNKQRKGKMVAKEHEVPKKSQI